MTETISPVPEQIDTQQFALQLWDGPRLRACTDHSRCCVHSRATRLRPATMPCSASSSVLNR